MLVDNYSRGLYHLFNYTGTTLAILSLLKNIPVVRHWLTISVIGEISVVICFRRAVNMLSWPQLCLDLILVIMRIKFKIMMLLIPQIFITSIIICVIVSASNIYEEGIEMIS